MTATNMCSNFGGKWDSPPVVTRCVCSQHAEFVVSMLSCSQHAEFVVNTLHL